MWHEAASLTPAATPPAPSEPPLVLLAYGFLLSLWLLPWRGCGRHRAIATRRERNRIVIDTIILSMWAVVLATCVHHEGVMTKYRRHCSTILVIAIPPATAG